MRSDDPVNVWKLASPFLDTKSRVQLRPIGDEHGRLEHALG
ncbi:hypothetical protein SF83666_b56420 (plasmid) [Sinorhizobium fredii CCBAU 83666]|nr:hypothetical protein SF83666_b56420 [Sinorhizobium fredii CCBAU 83666]